MTDIGTNSLKGLVVGLIVMSASVDASFASDAARTSGPEPMEYVRLCDAYGAGFFYIPGTKSCLRLSGYIWTQTGAATRGTAATTGTAGTTSNSLYLGGNGWEQKLETRVDFDARTETELGTLRALLRLQSNWNGDGDGALTADQAILQIGGLTMGYTESFWHESKDNGVSNWGSHSWQGLWYGYEQRALIGYTFKSGGLIAALALEDDALAGNGYVPDIVGKIAYEANWGAVWARLAFDESFDGSTYSAMPGIHAAGSNRGGWAASLGAQINISNTPGSNLRLIGYWADGSSTYNAGSTTVEWAGFGNLYYGSEWSILAAYNHKFTDNFGVSIAAHYFKNLYYSGTDLVQAVEGGRGTPDAWAAELSAIWYPFSNFEVRSELHYDNIGSHEPGIGAVGDPAAAFSGYLRFTRHF